VLHQVGLSLATIPGKLHIAHSIILAILDQLHAQRVYTNRHAAYSQVTLVPSWIVGSTGVAAYFGAE
jgi:hypothetical protein